MQHRPSASMSLIACGIVGIFPAVIHRFEAQTGAVHMQILRAFGGRHLRKFMGELHQRSSQRDGPSLGGGEAGATFCAGRATTGPTRLCNLLTGATVPRNCRSFPKSIFSAGTKYRSPADGRSGITASLFNPTKTFGSEGKRR